jgi:hypothetical protein
MWLYITQNAQQYMPTQDSTKTHEKRLTHDGPCRSRELEGHVTYVTLKRTLDFEKSEGALTINEVVLLSINGNWQVLYYFALQSCGVCWSDPELCGRSYKTCWRYPSLLDNFHVCLQLTDPLVDVTKSHLSKIMAHVV